MATNTVKVKTGTQYIFANHDDDFVAGGAKTSLQQSGQTDVQIDLTDVADTAGWESVQVDLGATRADLGYSFMASFEFAATPVTGEPVELYWAPSPDSTAANGNVMSIDGLDAAAPSGIGTLAELVDACQFIGSFICTNDATGAIQTGVINREGPFFPLERYGILIVKNESGAAFHSDAVEIHISMTEILTDIQAVA